MSATEKSARSGRGVAADRSNSVAHLDAAAGEHHLDRILGQRILERRDCSLRNGAVGRKERLVARVLPVDRFEDDLPSRGRSNTTAALSRCCGTRAEDVARRLRAAAAAASASRRRVS